MGVREFVPNHKSRAFVLSQCLVPPFSRPSLYSWESLDLEVFTYYIHLSIRIFFYVASIFWAWDLTYRYSEPF